MPAFVAGERVEMSLGRYFVTYVVGVTSMLAGAATVHSVMQPDVTLPAIRTVVPDAAQSSPSPLGSSSPAKAPGGTSNHAPDTTGTGQ